MQTIDNPAGYSKYTRAVDCAIKTRLLLAADTRIPEHFAHSGHLGNDLARKLARGAAHGFHPRIKELLLHVGRVDITHDLLIEQIDDLRRRTRRREHA